MHCTILNTFKQFEYDITAIREDLRIIEAFKRDSASYYEDKDVMQYMKTRGIYVQRTIFNTFKQFEYDITEQKHSNETVQATMKTKMSYST